MTFEPSASQAQIDARQHAFDNQPDPTTLVSHEEIRAALLDRHTAATQDKLDAAHVAICGCGGLGSTIAVALTRIGVGHLHLIDFDRVDMTNLNRQQYFLKDLGQYKTEALRSNLRQINPFIDITIDTVKVTAIWRQTRDDKVVQPPTKAEAYDDAKTRQNDRFTVDVHSRFIIVEA